MHRKPLLQRQSRALTSSCAGKQILEVGSGGNPAVAFAALRHCRRVVATDGSPQALRLLKRNVCTNARSVGMHHLPCRHSSELLFGIQSPESAMHAFVSYLEEIFLLASEIHDICFGSYLGGRGGATWRLEVCSSRAGLSAHL